ncbi:MAG: IclR family transcriptional regulator [Deltaproteobacteria bacterium]|nr:IclR family transcriptional regulator [Deltaproteobacteria bacterium]
MEARYTAPTVRKAFEILGLLARNGGGLSLSDVSKTLRISKSTAHGIVSALEDAGAIARAGGTKRLTLGVTLFELGSAVRSRMDLARAARPIMEALRTETDESVFLGVRSGDHVTIVDVAESGHALKIAAPVGTGIPLLAGATGKAFLSALSDGDAARLVREKGLRAYTGKSIVDPGRFADELAAVRRDGYSTDDEEYMQGVRAVAAPIPAGQSVAAAIWVVGFTSGIDEERLRSIGLSTKAAAGAISARLAGGKEGP